MYLRYYTKKKKEKCSFFILDLIKNETTTKVENLIIFSTKTK